MTNENVDPAERLAMFRYCVISEAISPRLSPAERGRVVRELAARTWVTPEGTERSFSRTSIDRWLRAYSKQGLAGLAKLPRSDRGRPRREGRWLAEAAKLRRAVPAPLVSPDRRHNRPGARGLALRAHRQGAPPSTRPFPPGTELGAGPCLRAF